MKLSSKVTELTKIIAPAVAVCDVDLWGVEFSPQGKRSLLRIYIDALPEAKAEGKQASIDDCARVNHQVSGVLEVHDPIAGEYVLEVSTPGIDRAFFTSEQMAEYVGQTVNLRLIHAIDSKAGKRRKVQGTLNSIDIDGSKSLSVTCDGEELQVLLNNIDKANLIYQ